MKNILLVYDRMMIGGTTTALLSLLSAIDYSEYSVDLLLFKNEGSFMDMIPKEVNLLPEACRPVFGGAVPLKLQKALISVFNGKLFGAMKAFLKYRGTQKGSLSMILYYYFADAAVISSRKLTKKYDAVVSFIEGWSTHYAMSGKVDAKYRACVIHPDYINSSLIPEADKKVFSVADNIFTVSENCKVNMCKVFPEYTDKTEVLENICSAKYIRARAEAGNEVMEKHSLDLCTVCRCDVQVKGLDRMISALSRLKKEGLLGNVHWHLIGGGDDFLMVRRMVDEENLSDNVTMYGSMDNPLTLLSQADMFVLTSRYEGKPVSVVEAQVLGVPCFVTAFASAPEQVTDGVNGMICENSTDGVYRGLKYIVSNISVVEKFRKELSENICDNSTEVQKLYNFWKNKI